MEKLKLGFGSDHAGFLLKETLREYLSQKGYECVDYGTTSEDRVDYPDYGKKVALAVKNGEVDKGILVCGSGIGIGISANKIKGIRCAMVSESYSAAMSVRHNNANMISLGSRVVGEDVAKLIVDSFLEAEFEGGRHAGRVDKICAIEEE